MNRIISLIRRPAKLIIIISLCAYLLFDFIFSVGLMAGGGAGTIFGSLMYFIVSIGLVGGLILALLLKKNRASLVLGSMLLAYKVITYVVAPRSRVLDAPGDGGMVAYDVFLLLSTICLMAALAIYVIGLFFHLDRFGKITRIIGLCGMAAFFLLTMISQFIYMGIAVKYLGDGAWVSVMSALSEIFLLPAILLGYLLLCVPEVEEKKEPEPEESK